MKNKAVKGMALLLTGALLLGGCGSAGSESGSTEQVSQETAMTEGFAETENDVTVTLRTDKERYEEGEEIRFSLEIANNRDHWNIAGRKFYYSLSDDLGAAEGTKLPNQLPIIRSGESTELTGSLLPGGEVPEAMPAGTPAATVTGSEMFSMRPYVQVQYAGKEMTVRMVLNIEMVEVVQQFSSSQLKKAKSISCHDPSIFKDFDGTYYVVGTHITSASSQDLFDWTSRDGAFRSALSEETKAQIRAWNKDEKSGEWFGYLWAPDIIYNTAMQKYCIYLSANGDDWVSNIVLLTGDSMDGPFEYAGTVVYGGFTEETFRETDVPQVLGDELPDRYIKNGVENHKWGDEYPNCIDACVFYDEEGRLWMSYGSWSGGIFLLELDEETGLRDYAVTYETNAHSDAYFGTKIAGGKYVSGEGSYVQHIGDYYYLFISYGGLSAREGYNIRIYRSTAPDGPYVDALGNSALFDAWVQNFNLSVGVRLFGSYKWRNMSVGQVAQGHNSAFVDDDGKAYIVFHTRTTSGNEGHYVKVHQLFMNSDGWLVAAPYQTDGETLPEQGYEMAQVAGTYDVILHILNVDYENLGTNTPKTVELGVDGSISGAYTGSWYLEEGTPYITLEIEGVSYKGVTLEMEIENTSVVTMTFTALGEQNQLTVWGSRQVE
jgi:beta-xylosidase